MNEIINTDLLMKIINSRDYLICEHMSYTSEYEEDYQSALNEINKIKQLEKDYKILKEYATKCSNYFNRL